MRLCSSEQPAHISLIRRRSRSIVSRAPAPSGNYLRSPAQGSDVNIDDAIEGAVTNRLTAGPSISASMPHAPAPESQQHVFAAFKADSQVAVSAVHYQDERPVRT